MLFVGQYRNSIVLPELSPEQNDTEYLCASFCCENETAELWQ